MPDTRNTPIWPFPGQEAAHWWEAYPPHNLPPPRFQVGDRVECRWYFGTVIRVYDYEHFGSRCYQVRGDCSDAPPGFGHRWAEDDLQPARELPAEDAAEVPDATPAARMPQVRRRAPEPAAPAQAELF